ncbi:uncharacterized protein LOC134080901 [Sardina pilchardus]|uniref:uncharacterized protein LOC134080901 n=1 Tax=Sardina pilchardus TaxID=27697 RepID=UPI002E1279C9
MEIPRSDEERRQMTWAEQVDLAYPLEECWSETCLTVPHLCMGDHYRPEVRSGEQRPEDVICWDQTLAHRDPFALRKVEVPKWRRRAENVVSWDQNLVNIDPFALRKVEVPKWRRRAENVVVSWDQPLVDIDPFALMKVSTKVVQAPTEGPLVHHPRCREAEEETKSCPPHTTLAFPQATVLDLRPPGQSYSYIHSSEISFPL